MLVRRTYTPDEILRAAWRRRYVLLGTFAIGAVCALMLAFSLTYSYRSLATIQMVPRVSSGLVPAADQRLEERLPALGQQFMTRDRLERIINEFDLYQKLRKAEVMEVVVEQMRNDITFEPVNKEVFRLGYTAKDPALALKVTNELTDLFIADNARNREVMADATSEFLQKQVDDARARLEEQEKTLDAYREKYAGQLPSQLEANLQGLSAAEKQLQTVVDAMDRDRDQRDFLERQLQYDTDGPATAPAPAPAATLADPTSVDGGTPAAQLAAARASLRAAELRLTPQHPDILRLKRVIADLEQKVATGPATQAGTQSAADAQRDGRRNQLRAELAQIDRNTSSRQAEERRLRATIEDFRARIRSAPLRESELAALTRDYDALQRAYTTLVGKQQDAAIAANLERGDIGDRFKVLEQARLPEKPFKPSRRQVFLIGLVVALAASLAAAGALEFRDTSVRTEQDVLQRFGLPTLATVPVMRAPRVSARRLSDTMLLILAAAASLGLAVLMSLNS